MAPPPPGWAWQGDLERQQRALDTLASIASWSRRWIRTASNSQRRSLEVWFDDGRYRQQGGTVASDTAWTAAGGPYHITSTLTIGQRCDPDDRAWHICLLWRRASISLLRMAAVCLPKARGGIRFVSPSPRVGRQLGWHDHQRRGRLAGNTNCLRLLRRQQCDLHRGRRRHAVTWTTPLRHHHASVRRPGRLIRFVVSNCVFPTSTAAFELLHGTGGIKSWRARHRAGMFISERPAAYNDIMDFTGGNRD